MEKRLENGNLVLSIETSTRSGSAALLRNGRVLVSEVFGAGEVLSEVLVLRVSQLIGRSGFAFGDVSSIVVGTGPGSLTGIRIGVSAAKGLAKGLRAQCIGVGVFDALAAAVEVASDETLLVVPGGRSEYYWQSLSARSSRAVDRGTAGELLAVLEKTENAVILREKDQGFDFVLPGNVVYIENLAELGGRAAFAGYKSEAGVRLEYFYDMNFKKSDVI